MLPALQEDVPEGGLPARAEHGGALVIGTASEAGGDDGDGPPPDIRARVQATPLLHRLSGRPLRDCLQGVLEDAAQQANRLRGRNQGRYILI